jgi:hypothetical protein
LSHLYGDEDLKQMGFQQDFDWSQPPSKKFKKVKVPHLVACSYSSSRETDEAEDLNDTAACPTPTDDPSNAGAPPSIS